jgi:hypothetical protein
LVLEIKFIVGRILTLTLKQKYPGTSTGRSREVE